MMEGCHTSHDSVVVEILKANLVGDSCIRVLLDKCRLLLGGKAPLDIVSIWSFAVFLIEQEENLAIVSWEDEVTEALSLGNIHLLERKVRNVLGDTIGCKVITRYFGGRILSKISGLNLLGDAIHGLSDRTVDSICSHNNASLKDLAVVGMDLDTILIQLNVRNSLIQLDIFLLLDLVVQ
jgi:hypothetical protein